MADWIADPIYREVVAHHSLDPLPFDPPPPGMVRYGDHSDWFTPGIPPRIDGWCEDRDPQADWELTDIDGRE